MISDSTPQDSGDFIKNDLSRESGSTESQASAALYGAKYISIERRSPRDTVFMVDDAPFQSSMPQPTHWSIAWSDLMMTMFVLFLSMYIYHTANEDFLTRDEPEVIGGDTTEALETERFSGTGFPIIPIAPVLSPLTSGTIKQTETTIAVKDIDIESSSRDFLKQDEVDTRLKEPSQKTRTAMIIESPGQRVEIPDPDRETIQPRPLIVDQPPPASQKIEEIYRLSRESLAGNNLDKFATIELVPDKTVRIVLTSDLIFKTGRETLDQQSRDSLQKVASTIRNTPYMINVVGHTDNVPMNSNRFAGNWELSVARASAVARFLIENMGMDPKQFVVSGYSSYRPIVPNTTYENRARNRRVEIIISKRLPQPEVLLEPSLQKE